MTINKTTKTYQRLGFVLIIVCLIILTCSTQQKTDYKAAWPPTSHETQPWTRWWWHGSAVNKADLTANLEKLKNAGIGGVEITPIYGVKGYEKQDISFLTSEWMDVFSHTLEETQRLGMGVDLANASGWPFGGPWVSADDACKNVRYKFYTLQEGRILEEKMEFVQKSLVRAVGHRVDISEVKFPINSNNRLQELALDQVRFQKKLPLQTIMAYNEKGMSLDLTDKVDNNGNLDWTAPEGIWKLYAVFQGWHGKMVERAGKGGEGNVIDHFSESATQNFLNVFDKEAKDFEVKGLRAFFNDSYEVDDAQGEADWTPLMFKEFEKLRGYNLKGYLPALFGQDTEEMTSRVICDYRATISDLLLERFTKVWADWSRKYNAVVRNQAHGAPANILDLYAASDIPETEGITPMRIKMATSAGHVSGKSIIACEAATWLDEHFLSDLSDVKMNLDRYFTHGVNHVVYHGTPYSPDSEEWPGWMFYASVHFAPTNTWWDDMKIINSYVTNCQSFMQNSTPANDILLYFPFYDTWSKKGNSMLHHFGKQNEELTKDLSEMFLANGYTFDYISDKQIQELQVESERIHSHKAEYKTIIIPQCEYILFQTMQKIISMARQGATVILQSNFPKDVPGLYKLEDRQKAYKELINDIGFAPEGDMEISRVGSGRILKGNDMEIILSAADVYPEPMVKSGLWCNRVIREEGVCYFISNWGYKDLDQWINIRSSGKDAVWFNPMNKDFGRAKTKNINSEHPEVYVQLEKGESLILQLYPTEQKVKEYPLFKETNNILPLDGDWTIDFLKGGPTLPKSYVTNELKSWTTHSDELKWFSGTARYKTTFEMPSIDASVYKLNLGEVFESAVVYINGEKLSTLVGPVFQLTVKADMLQKTNDLEVFVTNLMANRIIDLDRRGVNYKKFYNINFAARKRENLGKNGVFTAKHWEPLESGLLGPVTLTALQFKK